MARSATVWRFFLVALAWFLALTVAWMQVSAWTSYPAGGLTRIVLGNGARQWVRAVHHEPGRIEVDTRVVVPAAAQGDRRGMAELIAEVETARYAYGLPLFLALLFAARGKHLLRKAGLGYVILLVPQTFSLVFSILKQIMVAGSGPAALGIDAWQMEGIALGYQFGSLLLPTLAPVLLWFWFDRAFFSSIVVEGWLARNSGGGTDS
jgi:hypothetical protein